MGKEKLHRRLVVALHDVAPPFEAEIRAQLEAIRSMGVDRCVLKVVPNWHGAYPIGASPSFVRLLKERIESGDQILLHGWKHEAEGHLGGSPANRLRASLFAGDAAEFLTLSEQAAGEAVNLGIEALRACDIEKPTAFSAPAWLISAEAKQGVRDAGVRNLVGMFTLEDLSRGTGRRMPAFGYLGSGRKQEIGVRLMGGLIRRVWLPRVMAAKVFLHPQGGIHNPPMRRTLEQIAKLVQAGWEPATYEDLVGADD